MRTFAMVPVGAAFAVIMAIFIILATQPFAADFMAIIIGLVILFAVVGLTSVAWPGARTRSSRRRADVRDHPGRDRRGRPGHHRQSDGVARGPWWAAHSGAFGVVPVSSSLGSWRSSSARV
jgi:hypothetical protein